jgi:quercetin dioxygenase-like cupin family protein
MYITPGVIMNNKHELDVHANEWLTEMPPRTNEAYVTAVNEGKEDLSVRVPLDKPFEDDRGTIQNLWLGNSGSVTIITSKAGSVRANHIHHNDWHSSYVVSGSIKYEEANEDGSNHKEFVFNKGDMFFSPPARWHKMTFLEDTVFLTINNIVKNHENYTKTMQKITF